jgi:hypothetical protein
MSPLDEGVSQGESWGEVNISQRAIVTKYISSHLAKWELPLFCPISEIATTYGSCGIAVLCEGPLPLPV